MVGTILDCWPSAETYLSDFRARAGDQWARTAWQTIDVQRKSADKVHLVAQINRFDINGQLIADFDSLWGYHFEKWQMSSAIQIQFYHLIGTDMKRTLTLLTLCSFETHAGDRFGHMRCLGTGNLTKLCDCQPASLP